MMQCSNNNASAIKSPHSRVPKTKMALMSLVPNGHKFERDQTYMGAEAIETLLEGEPRAFLRKKKYKSQIYKNYKDTPILRAACTTLEAWDKNITDNLNRHNLNGVPLNINLEIFSSDTNSDEENNKIDQVRSLKRAIYQIGDVCVEKVKNQQNSPENCTDKEKLFLRFMQSSNIDPRLLVSYMIQKKYGNNALWDAGICNVQANQTNIVSNRMVDAYQADLKGKVSQIQTLTQNFDASSEGDLNKYKELSADISKKYKIDSQEDIDFEKYIPQENYLKTEEDKETAVLLRTLSEAKAVLSKQGSESDIVKQGLQAINHLAIAILATPNRSYEFEQKDMDHFATGLHLPFMEDKSRIIIDSWTKGPLKIIPEERYTECERKSQSVAVGYKNAAKPEKSLEEIKKDIISSAEAPSALQQAVSEATDDYDILEAFYKDDDIKEFLENIFMDSARGCRDGIKESNRGYLAGFKRNTEFENFCTQSLKDNNLKAIADILSGDMVDVLDEVSQMADIDIRGLKIGYNINGQTIDRDSDNENPNIIIHVTRGTTRSDKEQYGVSMDFDKMESLDMSDFEKELLKTMIASNLGTYKKHNIKERKCHWDPTYDKKVNWRYHYAMGKQAFKTFKQFQRTPETSGGISPLSSPPLTPSRQRSTMSDDPTRRYKLMPIKR